MGTKECPLPLVLCASDLNQCPRCEDSNSPYRGHAQSPLKYIPLCVKSVGHRTRIKL